MREELRSNYDGRRCEREEESHEVCNNASIKSNRGHVERAKMISYFGSSIDKSSARVEIQVQKISILARCGRRQGLKCLVTNVSFKSNSSCSCIDEKNTLEGWVGKRIELNAFNGNWG